MHFSSSVSQDEASASAAGALGVVASRGDAQLLLQLLRQGRPPDAADAKGWQPVHKAAHNGRIDCVRILLQQSNVRVNCQTLEGETPLYLCCASRNSHERQLYLTAKFLVENGADVNIAGSNGKSALHEAVGNDSMERVKLLLDHGANVNAQDYLKRTPMHFAAARNCTDVTQLLISQGSDYEALDFCNRSPLFLAVKWVALHSLRVLLSQKDVRLNSRTSDGETPLIMAAMKGSMPCVELLIKHGADPNISDGMHYLPIHYATEMGHADILQMLLNVMNENAIEECCGNGQISPDIRNPWCLAIDFNKWECLQILIKSGFKLNNYYQQGFRGTLVTNFANEGILYDSVLGHALAGNGDKENQMNVIHALLEAGANVNETNELVCAPLSRLAENERIEWATNAEAYGMFGLLIQKRVDVDYRIRSTFEGPDAIFRASLKNPTFLPLLLSHSKYTASDIMKAWMKYANSQIPTFLDGPHVHASYSRLVAKALTHTALVLVEFAGSDIGMSHMDEFKIAVSLLADLSPAYEQVYARVGEPCSLKHLCRHSIRSSFKASLQAMQVKEAIQELKIPHELGQYLMYSELDAVAFMPE